MYTPIFKPASKFRGLWRFYLVKIYGCFAKLSGAQKIPINGMRTFFGFRYCFSQKAGSQQVAQVPNAGRSISSANRMLAH
jgi:hypothetical protein